MFRYTSNIDFNKVINFVYSEEISDLFFANNKLYSLVESLTYYLFTHLYDIIIYIDGRNDINGLKLNFLSQKMEQDFRNLEINEIPKNISNQRTRNTLNNTGQNNQNNSNKSSTEEQKNLQNLTQNFGDFQSFRNYFGKIVRSFRQNKNKVAVIFDNFNDFVLSLYQNDKNMDDMRKLFASIRTETLIHKNFNQMFLIGKAFASMTYIFDLNYSFRDQEFDLNKENNQIFNIIEITKPNMKEIENFIIHKEYENKTKFLPLKRFTRYFLKKGSSLNAINKEITEKLPMLKNKNPKEINIKDFDIDGLLNDEPERKWNEIILENETLSKLKNLSELMTRALYENDYSKIPMGVLFTGEPGTGKTFVGNLLAEISEWNYIKLGTEDITKETVGGSAKALKEIFQNARTNAPSVIFVDEIDDAFPKRTSDSRAVSERVNTLLANMGGLKSTKDNNVMIIGATNYSHKVDDAVLSRFKSGGVIHIGLPDKYKRREMFELFSKKHKASLQNIDVEKLTDETEGMTGRDIENVIKSAINENNSFSFSEQKEIMLTEEYLTKAIQDWFQSLINETKGPIDYVLSPLDLKNVNFIGYNELKKRMAKLINNLDGREKQTNGLLLYGPYGNGKTFFMKYLAKEHNMIYLEIMSTNILSKWVGESGKNLEDIFKQAATYAKSRKTILFFDEIDSVLSSRGRGDSSGVNIQVRGTFLQCINRYKNHKNLLIACASNFYDKLDKASIRKGRFDIHEELPKPSLEDIKLLLPIFLNNNDLDPIFYNLELLAEAMKDKSISEIEETIIAVKDEVENKIPSEKDFLIALKNNKKIEKFDS